MGVSSSNDNLHKYQYRFTSDLGEKTHVKSATIYKYHFKLYKLLIKYVDDTIKKHTPSPVIIDLLQQRKSKYISFINEPRYFTQINSSTMRMKYEWEICCINDLID
jgi:hypothetical protein